MNYKCRYKKNALFPYNYRKKACNKNSTYTSNNLLNSFLTPFENIIGRKINFDDIIIILLIYLLYTEKDDDNTTILLCLLFILIG